MKSLILSFILLVSTAAHAVTAENFFASFAQDDEVARATNAYAFCEENFASPTYQTVIQQLGAAWATQPDPAYYLLNTCQTIWLAKYLDPLKPVKTEATQDHARLAYYFANLDLLNLPKYLREEVRIFTTARLNIPANIPVAPYEILTQMASTDRELDESIQTEVRQAKSAIASAAGWVVGLKAAKAVASGWSARASTAARVSKNMIIAALFAGAAYEAADVWLYHTRQKQLWSPVAELTLKLSQTNSPAPTPVLLNEFYRATERLGYFYSYSLYLDESGAGDQGATANQTCAAQIKDYFTEPSALAQTFAIQFGSQKVCADAVSLWIGASEYIRQSFPKDAQAQLLSARLLTRAKRTFMSYAETAALEATQPICVPSADSGGLVLECRDRATGALIL